MTKQRTVPRKPVDLVILQDASGSFKNTIPNVQNALGNTWQHLSVKKIMMRIIHVWLRLITRIHQTELWWQPSKVQMDTTITTVLLQVVKILMVVRPGIMITNTSLATCLQIKMISINSLMILRWQDLPVPAIDDAVAQYNQRKGNMANGRKTIFLWLRMELPTGNVGPDGKVCLEYSDCRNILTRALKHLKTF